jgi:DNA-binding transcriptional MocR family regulator
MTGYALLTEAELEPQLRRPGGAPCVVQAKVLAALMRRLGEDGTGQMPNLAAIARELGTVRQVVSAAVGMLQRKGFVVLRETATEVVEKKRKVDRTMVLVLPEPDQLTLPLSQPQWRAGPVTQDDVDDAYGH